MTSASVRTPLLTLIVCLTFNGFPNLLPPASAEEDPAARGLAIAEAARDRDEGFGNLTATTTMVLRNKQGQESRRELRLKVLELIEDGDKSLFVFDKPRDVQGTALLVHAHRTGPDDQWLYLPALKRVKRISSANRSGSFMGSEFAYEDMTAQEVEKYTYLFLREEPCGVLTCSVVERYPVDKDSGYRRQIFWLDTEHLRIWKIEYYDRKDTHMKTLVNEDYQEYLGRFWRAQRVTMTNHVNGKSTLMDWKNYQFQTDLDERDFTKTGLRRAR